MQFSQHALEKCALYGVNPELVRDAAGHGCSNSWIDPEVAVLTPDDAE